MSLFIALFTWLGLLLGQDSAELVFAGDAMQHQGQLDAAVAAAKKAAAYRHSSAPSGSGRTGKESVESRTKYSYRGCFDAVTPDIITADYAVVNLETPVSEAHHFSGYPCFNAPVEFARALRDMGFDLFLTANNHTLDRHDRGLVNTCRALDSLGVDHIGTYPDAAAREKTLPLVRTINNIKFGFLNYTYGTNGIQPGPEVVVDYISRERMKSDIAAARRAGAEIVIVAVHWGDEYKLLPNASQRSLAGFLVDQGVDAVIGSHPHVIQPMEIITRNDGEKALVVYSLGNYISNMKTRDTRGGAIVKTLFVRDGDGRVRLHDAAYDLVFTVPPSGSETNYRLMPVDEAVGHPVMGAHARAFRQTALGIFGRYNKKVGRAGAGMPGVSVEGKN